MKEINYKDMKFNPFNLIGGEWQDDVKPYHVIHRIASYPDVHGIFSDIKGFCFSRDANIRIDTHKDNLMMQHNIEKHGFTYCGIIYLANGDERLAYQKFPCGYFSFDLHHSYAQI